MKKTENKGPALTSHDDHLDQKYGIKGTPSRDAFELEYEAFKLGVILQQMREESGLTQQQLAEKCGTTKTYISRIENDASDIRFSTLMRIFKMGFGKTVQLSFT